MKVRFLNPAQSEVDDAVAWYDSQSRSLGTQFLDDLDRTVRRIVAYPLTSTKNVSFVFAKEFMSKATPPHPYPLPPGNDTLTKEVISKAT